MKESAWLKGQADSTAKDQQLRRLYHLYIYNSGTHTDHGQHTETTVEPSSFSQSRKQSKTQWRLLVMLGIRH